MEAAEGLHGYRGKEVGNLGSKKADGRDCKVFKQWEGKKGGGGEEQEMREEEQGEEVELDANVEMESCVDVKGAVGKFESEKAEEADGAADNTDEQPAEAKTVQNEDAPEDEKDSVTDEAPVVQEDSTGEEKEAVDGLVDMLKTTDTTDAAPDDEKEEQAPAEQEKEEPLAEEAAPEAKEEPVSEPTPEPEPVQEPTPVPPPTYSKTDVKFSFGLIVRSNHPTGNFDENLRDNETLRKCMASTSKILIKEMPSPPEIKDDIDMDYSTFPKAYYDPSLKPTVLSIEEDTKKDGSEMMERGNKRTLVKASFPVFLQNMDDNDKSKALLKETKSTVFRALRAAVSGGQFLR